MTMMSGEQPANMTGGSWGIAETSFRVLPTLETGASEAWIVWTPEQTLQMTPGRKRLRLRYLQPNGDVKVFPDLTIAVE